MNYYLLTQLYTFKLALVATMATCTFEENSTSHVINISRNSPRDIITINGHFLNKNPHDIQSGFLFSVGEATSDVYHPEMSVYFVHYIKGKTTVQIYNKDFNVVTHQLKGPPAEAVFPIKIFLKFYTVILSSTRYPIESLGLDRTLNFSSIVMEAQTGFQMTHVSVCSEEITNKFVTENADTSVCEVTGLPFTEVLWYLGEKRLILPSKVTQVFDYDTSVFRIRSELAFPSTSDICSTVGSFSCVIYNNLDHKISKKIISKAVHIFKFPTELTINPLQLSRMIFAVSDTSASLNSVILMCRDFDYSTRIKQGTGCFMLYLKSDEISQNTSCEISYRGETNYIHIKICGEGRTVTLTQTCESCPAGQSSSSDYEYRCFNNSSQCEANYYGYGKVCTTCPLSQISPELSTSLESCIYARSECRRGYYGIRDACYPCPVNRTSNPRTAVKREDCVPRNCTPDGCNDADNSEEDVNPIFIGFTVIGCIVVIWVGLMVAISIRKHFGPVSESMPTYIMRNYSKESTLEKLSYQSIISKQRSFTRNDDINEQQED